MGTVSFWLRWHKRITNYVSSSGTQDIVLNDDRILFVSLHRYDNASYYPEKLDSNYNISKNVVNIPWSGGPMGDKEYLASFLNVILPIAYNFAPELVLVSAGFDAAQGNQQWCFFLANHKNFLKSKHFY